MARKPRKQMNEDDSIWKLSYEGYEKDELRFALRIFIGSGYTLKQARRVLRSVIYSNKVIGANLYQLCNAVVYANKTLKEALYK